MTSEQLYKKFAKYYDKVYYDKDYAKEVDFINWAVKKYKKSKGTRLLDIACGTGSHAALLKNDYSILGLDLNPEMLKLAKKKAKGVSEAEITRGLRDLVQISREIGLYSIVTCKS